MNNNNATQVYTFYSAKKIYYAKTPSKCLLIEKKESTPSTRILSLISRNTIMYNKSEGILIFPKA